MDLPLNGFFGLTVKWQELLVPYGNLHPPAFSQRSGRCGLVMPHIRALKHKYLQCDIQRRQDHGRPMGQLYRPSKVDKEQAVSYVASASPR
jgi:hypothetical protein